MDYAIRIHTKDTDEHVQVATLEEAIMDFKEQILDKGITAVDCLEGNGQIFCYHPNFIKQPHIMTALCNGMLEFVNTSQTLELEVLLNTYQNQHVFTKPEHSVEEANRLKAWAAITKAKMSK